MLNTIDLFISHSWNYGDHYSQMIKLLDNRRYFNFNDHSIPKDDPIHNTSSDKALRAAIEKKITKAQVVIIPAGVYASYSRWINEEIDLANLYEIPILAVVPWGQKNLSTVVMDNASKDVRWNTESIVEGIRELV